jgi:hypothetical protein
MTKTTGGSNDLTLLRLREEKVLTSLDFDLISPSSPRQPSDSDHIIKAWITIVLLIIKIGCVSAAKTYSLLTIAFVS